jgi:hypothetical protein
VRERERERWGNLESFDFVDLKKNYSVFGDFENH